MCEGSLVYEVPEVYFGSCMFLFDELICHVLIVSLSVVGPVYRPIKNVLHQFLCNIGSRLIYKLVNYNYIKKLVRGVDR